MPESPGAASGAVSAGTLKATLIAAAEAMAFAKIGAGYGETGPHGLEQVTTSALMHGVAGGLASVASGGKFQSGFLAAGFADVAGPFVDQISHGDIFMGTAASAVVGGMGSVVGGGKFENGAVTGAFGYLFRPHREEDINQSKDNLGNMYGPAQNGTFKCGDSVCYYTISTLVDAYGGRGVRIGVIYPGDGNEDWVQTYRAKGVGKDDGRPHLDCDYTPCPFTGPRGNSFRDSPRRGGDTIWSAETSAVLPNKTGGFSPVTTFAWGFQISGNSINFQAPHVVVPSTFQQQAVGSARQ